MVLDNDKDYYDVLLDVAKVRKYTRSKIIAQLPPSTQDIIKGKQNQARFDEKEATRLLEDAVANATCYVNGSMATTRATNAKAVFDEVLGKLAESVYSKAAYITAPVEGDGDIVRILRGQVEQGIEGMGGANEQACKEIADHLAVQDRIHQASTMEDVQRKFQGAPYGWREIDVAATVARLVASQDATVVYAGQIVAADDRRMLDCLRNRREVAKAQIKRRVKMNERLLKDCRDILFEFTGARDIPADEDGLVHRVKSELAEAIGQCQQLLRTHYSGMPAYPYPYKQAVEDGVHVLMQVQQQQNDPEALLRAFQKAEDNLLNFAEAKGDVDAFFPNQQRLFDESAKLLASIAEEGDSMEGDGDAQDAITQVKAILQSPKPAIPQLNNLNNRIRDAHDKVVAAHRADFLDALDREIRDLECYAADQAEQPEAAKAAFLKAQVALEDLKTQAHAKNTAQAIDALCFRLEQKAREAKRAIDAAVEEAKAKAAREISVPHETASGEIVNNVYQKSQVPPVSKPRVKEIKRGDVLPRKTLRSRAEVDACVEAVRAKLLEILDDNDAISLN